MAEKYSPARSLSRQRRGVCCANLGPVQVDQVTARLRLLQAGLVEVKVAEIEIAVVDSQLMHLPGAVRQGAEQAHPDRRRRRLHGPVGAVVFEADGAGQLRADDHRAHPRRVPPPARVGGDVQGGNPRPPQGEHRAILVARRYHRQPQLQQVLAHLRPADARVQLEEPGFAAVLEAQGFAALFIAQDIRRPCLRGDIPGPGKQLAGATGARQLALGKSARQVIISHRRGPACATGAAR